MLYIKCGTQRDDVYIILNWYFLVSIYVQQQFKYARCSQYSDAYTKRLKCLPLIKYSSFLRFEKYLSLCTNTLYIQCWYISIPLEYSNILKNGNGCPKSFVMKTFGEVRVKCLLSALFLNLYVIVYDDNQHMEEIVNFFIILNKYQRFLNCTGNENHKIVSLIYCEFNYFWSSLLLRLN